MNVPAVCPGLNKMRPVAVILLNQQQPDEESEI